MVTLQRVLTIAADISGNKIDEARLTDAIRSAFPNVSADRLSARLSVKTGSYRIRSAGSAVMTGKGRPWSAELVAFAEVVDLCETQGLPIPQPPSEVVKRLSEFWKD